MKEILGKKVRIKNGVVGIAEHYLPESNLYVLMGGRGFRALCEFTEEDVEYIYCYQKEGV